MRLKLGVPFAVETPQLRDILSPVDPTVAAVLLFDVPAAALVVGAAFDATPDRDLHR